MSCKHEEIWRKSYKEEFYRTYICLNCNRFLKHKDGKFVIYFNATQFAFTSVEYRRGMLKRDNWRRYVQA